MQDDATYRLSCRGEEEEPRRIRGGLGSAVCGALLLPPPPPYAIRRDGDTVIMGTHAIDGAAASRGSRGEGARERERCGTREVKEQGRRGREGGWRSPRLPSLKREEMGGRRGRDGLPLVFCVCDSVQFRGNCAWRPRLPRDATRPSQTQAGAGGGAAGERGGDVG